MWTLGRAQAPRSMPACPQSIVACFYIPQQKKTPLLITAHHDAGHGWSQQIDEILDENTLVSNVLLWYCKEWAKLKAQLSILDGFLRCTKRQ